MEDDQNHFLIGLTKFLELMFQNKYLNQGHFDSDTNSLFLKIRDLEFRIQKHPFSFCLFLDSFFVREILKKDKISFNNFDSIFNKFRDHYLNLSKIKCNDLFNSYNLESIFLIHKE